MEVHHGHLARRGGLARGDEHRRVDAGRLGLREHDHVVEHERVARELRHVHAEERVLRAADDAAVVEPQVRVAPHGDARLGVDDCRMPALVRRLRAVREVREPRLGRVGG